MINLEWLRTFKTIYEKGSMTAAAEALLISQPGVSLHLSSLESHVGYKLFERRPRKLVPTERGKLLYNVIVDPIAKLQEAEAHFQKSTGKDLPTLTVGMCFETFQMALEKHVPRLPFDLILEFGDYRDLLEKLEKGTIDFVVTPRNIETRGVEFRPFSREHIVLVAGRGSDTGAFHRLLDEDPDGVVHWLKSQKWYGITGDNEHLKRFWQRNFKTHPDFRPNYIVPNIHSIVRSLSSAPGLGVVPDFLCFGEVARGEIEVLWRGFEPLTNTIYFAKRKKAMHPDEIHRIEELLEKEMPSL